MIDFTKEEKELLETCENDEWKSVKNKKKEISRYQQAAKRLLSKKIAE